MRRLRGFLPAERGAAAAEFALVLALIVPTTANVVDLGLYGYRKVQVEMAAEAAVQAIRGGCTPAQTPITKNCATGLVTKITTAAQSTSLGTDVTVASGSPVEGYYCVNASHQLVLVGSTGTIGSPPSRPSTFDCSGSGSANTSPADYVLVTVNYTYSSLFPSASVVSLLPATITRTGWYRVT